MLGPNLTLAERLVLKSALRAQLASFEGMALYRRERGLKADVDQDRSIATLKDLIAQLG
jgi:hypothetical protein